MDFAHCNIVRSMGAPECHGYRRAPRWLARGSAPARPDARVAPYPAHDLAAVAALVGDPGELRRAACRSVRGFCAYVSNGEYVPTKDPLGLMPQLALSRPEIELMALSVTEADPGSIRKLGFNAFVARLSGEEGAFVFMHRGPSGVSAYVTEAVLRCALHVLCWASDRAGFPSNMRFRPKAPRGDLQVSLADIVRDGAAATGHKAYLGALIPATVSRMREVAAQLLSPEPPRAPVESCPVCLEDVREGASTALPCGHRIHDQCLRALRARSTTGTCPVCRTPF